MNGGTSSDEVARAARGRDRACCRSWTTQDEIHYSLFAARYSFQALSAASPSSSPRLARSLARTLASSSSSALSPRVVSPFHLGRSGLAKSNARPRIRPDYIPTAASIVYKPATMYSCSPSPPLSFHSCFSPSRVLPSSIRMLYKA